MPCGTSSSNNQKGYINLEGNDEGALINMITTGKNAKVFRKY